MFFGVAVSSTVQTLYVYSTWTMFFLGSGCEPDPTTLDLTVKPDPTTLFD
jgi:hypothetical protein